MALQVVPTAGHAKRMQKNARRVSVKGQVSTAREKAGADISIPPIGAVPELI